MEKKKKKKTGYKTASSKLTVMRKTFELVSLTCHCGNELKPLKYPDKIHDILGPLKCLKF